MSLNLDDMYTLINSRKVDVSDDFVVHTPHVFALTESRKLGMRDPDMTLSE